jgi:hypothetical protein
MIAQVLRRTYDLLRSKVRALRACSSHALRKLSEAKCISFRDVPQ